jgi:two-component system sensor histidine kinase RegB
MIAWRWIALAAAALAILATPPLLGIPLPQSPMLYVVGGMAALNLWLWRASMTLAAAGRMELSLQFCLDIGALALLLYLSGGEANPLVSLLLLPVAFGAAVLPPAYALSVAAASIAAYSALSQWSWPLSLPDHAYAMRLHLAGMWLTFVISALIIAWYIARLTATVRAREHELAASREIALRNERIVALGALAASAAHELGTPLATMNLLAGEMLADPALPEAAQRDLAVLRQQIAACKSILTGLAYRAGGDRAEGAMSEQADRWMQRLIARWHASRPHARAELAIAGDGDAPQLIIEATVEHALLNLLNNAADAAPQPVAVSLNWNRNALTIEIRDDGPGFDAATIEAAGRAPLPARLGSGGAGIGLLLAHAAIERAGGRVLLRNRAGKDGKPGGALILVELPVTRGEIPRDPA